MSVYTFGKQLVKIFEKDREISMGIQNPRVVMLCAVPDYVELRSRLPSTWPLRRWWLHIIRAAKVGQPGEKIAARESSSDEAREF